MTQLASRLSRGAWRLARRAWRLALHAWRFKLRAWRFKLRASRVALGAWRVALRTARFALGTPRFAPREAAIGAARRSLLLLMLPSVAAPLTKGYHDATLAQLWLRLPTAAGQLPLVRLAARCCCCCCCPRALRLPSVASQSRHSRATVASW